MINGISAMMKRLTDTNAPKENFLIYPLLLNPALKNICAMIVPIAR